MRDLFLYIICIYTIHIHLNVHGIPSGNNALFSNVDTDVEDAQKKWLRTENFV